MSGLLIHHFLFTARVTTPLELDEHSGAALRGNLYESVWGRFCTNKASPSCAACPLHTMCPVSALVAPLREENARGRDIPRPYIILPPLGKPRRYEPGERLLFGITLFGKIVELFPYIVMTLHTMEAHGLGKKVADHHGQRGRYVIEKIESYSPFSGKRQAVYTTGKPLVNVEMLPLDAQAVRERAARLPTTQVTIHYLTPTRLVAVERLVRQAAFQPLIQRLLERRTALELAYGQADTLEQETSERELGELAASVRCVEDKTSWDDVQSYSRRQGKKTPIGGIVGTARFEGDLAPFRQLLTWGELIHVGKSTVKGNGWYTLEA